MIVLFSGTGNTRRAARMLADILADEQVYEPKSSELRVPESILIDADRVIWAFPTYSWGIPPVMVEVIRRATVSDRTRRARHYMLTTCGDDMGYTDRQWRRLMKERGFDARSAYSVIMPNIYTLMKGFDVDSPEVEAEKLKAAHGRIAEIASSIQSGSDDILNHGAFPWIKSKVIYPWFVRHEMSPKPFHALAGCTGCGTCARNCPMGNISMQKETGTSVPVWGEDCAMCLRCYHICPHHCVAYGRKTLEKGQYRIK